MGNLWNNAFFSVIIPVYNAADTLPSALDSLVTQEFTNWQAIAVDDGSEDGSAAIAAYWAERNPRIQCIRSSHRGVSEARNVGAAAADGEWLLFLDADDWLLPTTLGAIARTAQEDPEAAAIFGSWSRATPDGTLIPEQYIPEEERMFELLACFCPLAVHCCALRRGWFSRAGGFDAALDVGEDWDFWQRVARVGTSFRRIDEQVAVYRMRPNSAVLSPRRLWDLGLVIIERGHSLDPRVVEPDPRYAAGAPVAELPAARLRFLCWPAGMSIGMGGDPAVWLSEESAVDEVALDPGGVASSVFHAALLPRCLTPGSSEGMWHEAWPRVERFLVRLEELSGTPSLAQRSLRQIERMVHAAAASQSKPTSLTSGQV